MRITSDSRGTANQAEEYDEMTSNDNSMQLLARWAAGDEAAADEIFAQYLERLVKLAQSRLSKKMQRRVDAEDVVQSAYRSFFRHAQNDRYQLKRSGDLWRLLAAITVNKAKGQIEHHLAAKRSIDGEASMPDESGSMLSIVAIAREPTIEEGVALADEVEDLMRSLGPMERRVLELRLQDRTTEEIGIEIDRTTRTVRRILDKLKVTLTERIEQERED